jgi:hypothetical protein
VNFRSPGQLALNEPFIADEVCSVTFHLKSVHVLGVGISVDDVQFPNRELLPAIEGSVSELLCSRLVQPAVSAAANDSTTRKVFFIGAIHREAIRESTGKARERNREVVIGRRNPAEQRVKSHNYTISSVGDSAGFARELDRSISVSICGREIRNHRTG